MSKIKVNSIEAATGTTITIPSGQTLDISSTTLTLPSTVVTTTGTQTLTNKTIGATQLTGTIPTTIGGTGLTTIGTSLQVLRVNSGATALEYGTVSGATAGQVIQVLSATDSTERTTTSTSFVTASNTLSVTITPASASNQVLILVSASGRTSEDTFYTVYRGATDLGATSSKGLGQVSGESALAGTGAGVGISHLDSPSTTSATTYQVYFRSLAGTSRLNYNSHKGSITVMEIKG
jgi:hypothetical protein